MKNLRIRILLGLSLLFSSPAISLAKDPKMPAVLKSNNVEMVLNGQGIRNKCWIDLFTGGLYLKTKSKDAAKIINADEHMAIKIEVTSDVITSKRLKDNMIAEFDRVAGKNTGVYKQRISGLVSAFNEDIKIGDTFDLIYHPQEGLKILKNGNLKTQVNGLDFKKLLFTIWLGEDPQDSSLKKGMLGVK